MARRHLAIFLKGVAEKILSGEKSIELRLTQSRLPPYGVIAKNDEIYLKNAGGLILGKVKVDNVLFYDHLTVEMIASIRREYQDAVRMDNLFWENKKNARYATIIFLEKPERFLAPIAFKKHDRRSWLILQE